MERTEALLDEDRRRDRNLNDDERLDGLVYLTSLLQVSEESRDVITVTTFDSNAADVNLLAPTYGET